VRKGEQEGMHWYDTYSLGGRAFFSGKFDIHHVHCKPGLVAQCHQIRHTINLLSSIEAYVDHLDNFCKNIFYCTKL
jgi:hypothetical protein